MCFETTKHQKPKIAKEDITCWKTLDRICNKYLSRIQDHEYVPGVLQPHVKIRKEESWGDYEINEGYHSFTERPPLVSGILKMFIIPKGTRYYHNRSNKEYVSETIMMAKE